MDCGVPFCHHGLPAREHDPRLERPRLPRPLERGDRSSSTGRTTSRSSPAGSVPLPARPPACSRSTRRRGHDQADRGLDHRSRLRGGLGRAPAAAQRTGKPRRRRRLRAGGFRVRAAAQPRRPRGHGLRARRAGGGLAALRHSRFQDREAPRRAPDPRRWSPKGSRCSTGVNVGFDVPCAELRPASTRSASPRRHAAPRPARPRPRARRRALRDGVPRISGPAGWRGARPLPPAPLGPPRSAPPASMSS